ncbi:hypothetical protein BDV95DRAFT_501500 [Massariosphaeria phaeospora]|uniref:Zn(2)-C6 fungal-type domain-containing protein n=1 Tax=Massariosphaeria phaeospora TaxID=100035 RepID=A0A7C8I108_9PLEO|nr:hypothetical protein BDV95DRAFT_501500 [Massariosphaeria phaeospora]
MPKARSTCTRCSMRRQKCDRKSPCSRCVLNKEGHLCSTQWPHTGYNASLHRKYPRKTSPTSSQRSDNIQGTPNTDDSNSQQPWPVTPISLQESSFSTERRWNATPPSTKRDFVTFGRPDFSNITIGSLLDDRDTCATNKDLMDQTLNQVVCKNFGENGAYTGFSTAARAVEVYHIQSLMPPRHQVFQMVDYHGNHMLYWAGGIYHGPSFRTSVTQAYGESDDLELRHLDWRWTALLFSVLSASIIGCPEATSTMWGFSTSEKVRLARQWGTAALSSLQLGDFASKHHIYSIQAILNLHASEHLVGSTKEWAVSQGAAAIIARGLGLNKLGPHPDDGKDTGLSAEQKEALLRREIGRRVWITVTSLDWLCSASLGMYTIQRKHNTSVKPSHFIEVTMTPITNGLTPAMTRFSNYLNEVAYLLVAYHDDMLDTPDTTTKYKLVLQYDSKLRQMDSEQAPKCLLPTTPFNPAWPRWVAWSRYMAQSSSAHKIIMIHQSFLGRSFQEPQYTYSRWACVEAAKTILGTMERTRDEQEPQWWVEQAFVVTAGLVLVLDLFHRSDKDPEVQNYQNSIERAIEILRRWPTSSVATHGIRLLSPLLQECNKRFVRSLEPLTQTVSAFSSTLSPIELADSVIGETRVPVPEAGAFLTVPLEVPSIPDVDMLEFQNLLDTLPPEVGFDNNIFFESMLSLTNSQFF